MSSSEHLLAHDDDESSNPNIPIIRHTMVFNSVSTLLETIDCVLYFKGRLRVRAVSGPWPRRVRSRCDRPLALPVLSTLHRVNLRGVNKKYTVIPSSLYGLTVHFMAISRKLTI